MVTVSGAGSGGWGKVSQNCNRREGKRETKGREAQGWDTLQRKKVVRPPTWPPCPPGLSHRAAPAQEVSGVLIWGGRA